MGFQEIFFGTFCSVQLSKYLKWKEGGIKKKRVIVQYLFKKKEAKVKYNYLNKANNLNKNIKGS